MATIENNKEFPKPDIVDYTVQKNGTISDILSAFGVKLSKFTEKVTKDGQTFYDVREWESFRFVKNKDGSGDVYRNSQKLVHLERNDIFQDIEKIDAFPGLTLSKKGDGYVLKNQKGPFIKNAEISVSFQNLDAFKEAVTKMSGPFIIECGARQSQYDLSCDIENYTTPSGAHPFPGTVSLQSEHFLDFLATDVDMKEVRNLMDIPSSISPVLLATAFAKTLPLRVNQ